MVEVKEQLEQCLDKFCSGTLTKGDLQRTLESVNSQIKANGQCQRLLYLQAQSTLVTSLVEAMAIVDGDGVRNGPDDSDDWPYQTVHEAMCNGWRIIKFPEMALMMTADDETYGIGCEFVLSK